AVPNKVPAIPRKATLVVDGTSVGQAGDFSSRAYPLWLPAGTHDLELSYKGYQTLRVRFEATRGRAYLIHYDLRGGEGLHARSSGDIHRQEGAPAAPHQVVEVSPLIVPRSPSLC